MQGVWQTVLLSYLLPKVLLYLNVIIKVNFVCHFKFALVAMLVWTLVLCPFVTGQNIFMCCFIFTSITTILDFFVFCFLVIIIVCFIFFFIQPYFIYLYTCVHFVRLFYWPPVWNTESTGLSSWPGFHFFHCLWKSLHNFLPFSGLLVEDLFDLGMILFHHSFLP